MEIRQFEPDDFLNLKLQPMQACLSFGGQTVENAQALRQSQESFTATVDGEIVACIGLIEFWPGRRMVWAYLSAGAGPHLLALTRRIRSWMRFFGKGRIEAAIDPQFEASVRWALLLGFQNETPFGMEEWIPGKTFHLYARVR
jgi:RimJ/RimL family protein N-acetyltransferase